MSGTGGGIVNRVGLAFCTAVIDPHGQRHQRLPQFVLASIERASGGGAAENRHRTAKLPQRHDVQAVAQIDPETGRFVKAHPGFVGIGRRAEHLHGDASTRQRGRQLVDARQRLGAKHGKLIHAEAVVHVFESRRLAAAFITGQQDRAQFGDFRRAFDEALGFIEQQRSAAIIQGAKQRRRRQIAGGHRPVNQSAEQFKHAGFAAAPPGR